jgi:hypothetical protein
MPIFNVAENLLKKKFFCIEKLSLRLKYERDIDMHFRGIRYQGRDQLGEIRRQEEEIEKRELEVGFC